MFYLSVRLSLKFLMVSNPQNFRPIQEFLHFITYYAVATRFELAIFSLTGKRFRPTKLYDYLIVLISIYSLPIRQWHFISNSQTANWVRLPFQPQNNHGFSNVKKQHSFYGKNRTSMDLPFIMNRTWKHPVGVATLHFIENLKQLYINVIHNTKTAHIFLRFRSSGRVKVRRPD